MLNFIKNKNEKKEEENLNFSLDKQIEAILFFKSEEVSLKYLIKILKKKKKEIKESIEVLKTRLKNNGLIIVEDNDRFLLTTRPEASEIIERIKDKEEYGELSNSALETLSIILYKKKATRAELDQIRGINSSYILRNLLIRGLINKKNQEGLIEYLPSLELLSYLGVESVEKLPSFESVREKISEIENQNLTVENKNENTNG